LVGIVLPLDFCPVGVNIQNQLKEVRKTKSVYLQGIDMQDLGEIE